MKDMTVELTLRSDLMSQVLEFIMEKTVSSRVGLTIKPPGPGLSPQRAAPHPLNGARNPAMALPRTKTGRVSRGALQNATVEYIRQFGPTGISAQQLAKGLKLEPKQASSVIWRLTHRQKLTKRLLNGNYTIR